MSHIFEALANSVLCTVAFFLDAVLHSIQQIIILHHHGVDLKDRCIIFSGFFHSFVIQIILLVYDSFHSIFKTLKFRLPVLY